MAVISLDSWTIYGANAAAVKVEVNLSAGLPCFTLVGLAETAVKEARERVRAAIQNCGLEFPTNKRITVNLAPADLPKESARFDLPIALAILAASKQIDAHKIKGYAACGELSLTGKLRPIQGALLIALAWLKQNRNAPQPFLLLPPQSAAEAALVTSAPIYYATDLLQIVKHCSLTTQQPDYNLPQAQRCLTTPPPTTVPDFSEVRGQHSAKRALEIAAAGGHSVLMVGPPGSGKSMLAQRFGGILPDMSHEQAVESAAIASLSNKFNLANWQQRPFCAPHHSASSVALIGGGSMPKPGEISLAHNGVLFLDELPEFARTSLEALREPLETGYINIARANIKVRFPAKFQLIAAMNPCPCGYFGSQQKTCHCSGEQIQRYQRKLSGPLLDRIDMFVEVAALKPTEILTTPAIPSENSASIKKRVITAQNFRINNRLQYQSNANLGAANLLTSVRLTASASNFLEQVAHKFSWSARSLHRTIKVARSIADLKAAADIEPQHIGEAIQYRRALTDNLLN